MPTRRRKKRKHDAGSEIDRAAIRCCADDREPRTTQPEPGGRGRVDAHHEGDRRRGFRAGPARVGAAWHTLGHRRRDAPLVNSGIAEQVQGMAEACHERDMQLLLVQGDFSAEAEEQAIRTVMGWGRPD
jgi:hypothetical protein